MARGTQRSSRRASPANRPPESRPVTIPTSKPYRMNTPTSRLPPPDEQEDPSWLGSSLGWCRRRWLPPTRR